MMKKAARWSGFFKTKNSVTYSEKNEKEKKFAIKVK